LYEYAWVKVIVDEMREERIGGERGLLSTTYKKRGL